MIDGDMPDPDARLSLARIAETLADPRVETHFAHRNKRTVVREVLDVLGIPHPDWVRRRLSGRAAITKAAMDRFHGDHPQERLRSGR